MVWKFVNAASGLVDGLDGEVSADCLSKLRTGVAETKRQGKTLRWCVFLRQKADIEFVQDELKLLRVRTKKQELVIVPDTKYLLIVIHETPTS